MCENGEFRTRGEGRLSLEPTPAARPGGRAWRVLAWAVSLTAGWQLAAASVTSGQVLASSSSSYGESVSVTLVPVLGPPASAVSGPLPTAGGQAPPVYHAADSQASVEVSLSLAGNILTTGLLTVTADGTTSVPQGAAGRAIVDDLAIRLAGSAPLLVLAAQVVDAQATVDGPCGSALTATGSTTFTNGSVGGLLGAGLSLPPHPAPNTLLLNTGGVRVVLNEQTLGGDGTHSRSLTVQAIHITLTNALVSGLGLLSGEVVVGHAQASLSCAPVQAQTDLGLTMVDDPDPVFSGAQLSYQLTVRNQGPNNASSVTVTDQLPADVGLLSATPSQGSCTGSSTVTCHLGAMAAGASSTITILVEAGATGTLLNTASVASELADPNPANNQASAETTVTEEGGGASRADLVLACQDSPDPVTENGTLRYEARVTNAGPDPAESAALIQTLPNGFEVTAVSTTRGSCTVQTAVSCDLGTLPAGAEARVTVQGRPNQRHSLVSHLQAASLTPDPDLTNNSDLVQTEIVVPVAADPAPCRQGILPAATLLIPYFEVDLGSAAGRTTLVGITNSLPSPQLVQATLWTDWAVPSLTFDLYLSGYDVQTLNLRDVFAGRVPSTGAAVSHRGELSAANDGFPGCNNGSTVGEGPVYGQLDDALVAHLRAWHTGHASPLSGLCGGSGEAGANLATGYLTLDVVNECSTLTPADPGYFRSGGRGIASNTNAIWGEFFLVDPSQDYAQGEMAVHLVADDRYSSGPTFYQRYVQGTGQDNRQPLASAYASRYLAGGVFTGGTELIVWRDTGSAAARPVACGQQPAWAPLAHPGLLAFDEAENPDFLGPASDRFGLATQRVKVGSSKLAVPGPFGFVSIDLSPFPNPPGSLRAQAWMMTLMSANGRFSVGVRSVALDQECGY